MTEPSPPERPQIPSPPPHGEAHSLRRLLLVAVGLIALGGGGLLAWDWLSHGNGGDAFVRLLPQAANRTAPESPPAPPAPSETPAAPNPTPSSSAPPNPAPSSASQPKSPPPADDVAARLAALEARLAQSAPPPAPPSQPAPASPADAQLAQLQARVASLETAVAVERARADRAEQAARAAADRLQVAVRAAGAIARLRTSLERGAPFEREYDDASAALSSDAPAVARLQPLKQWAESGIPTRTELRDALETQGGDIVRASLLEGAQTWWQAIVARIKALVVVRPTPDGDIPPAGTAEGDRAPAIVARAEAKLRDDDDVPAAVSELSTLNGAAADVAQAWIAAARARIAADGTMMALDDSLRSLASVPHATALTAPATTESPSGQDRRSDGSVEVPSSDGEP